MNDVFTNVSTNDLQDINGALSYFMFLQHENCPPNASCESYKSNCFKCWHDYIGDIIIQRRSKINTVVVK